MRAPVTSGAMRPHILSPAQGLHVARETVPFASRVVERRGGRVPETCPFEVFLRRAEATVPHRQMSVLVPRNQQDRNT